MKFIAPVLRISLCLSLFLVGHYSLNAQTSADDAAKEIIVRAITLYRAQRYEEALPYMKIMAEAAPDSPEIAHAYGMCLLGKSKQIKDTKEAQELSKQALEQFLRAKQLGNKTQENDALIALLSGKATSSPDQPMFSKSKDAEQAMADAETNFAQAKYDEAIKFYEKALAADPTIYQAALGMGDCYTAKSDWTNAEKAYQRAITIDPNRETAYRYSATPMMKQKKYDQALERYIEAYITEPYNRMSSRGISQWAEITEARLGHPKFDIPVVTFGSDGKATSQPALDPKDASLAPWIAYVATRENWKKERFAKVFPKETAYRHSMQEETEALRSAIAVATQAKSTDPQLVLLAKLDSDGVLDAYVLFARANQSIAGDHPEYLKTNRPTLRKYISKYVISK